MIILSENENLLQIADLWVLGLYLKNILGGMILAFF